MDRSHRLMGVLLVLCVVEAMFIAVLLTNNQQAYARFEKIQETLPVYVVPGAEAGTYVRRPEDMMLETFTNFITQGLYSYTFVTLMDQYKEMRRFMAPDLLAASDRLYQKTINIAQTDKRSALFIPNLPSIKWNKTGGERSRAEFDVEMTGSLQNIIAGTVVESLPLQIKLTVRQTPITQTNPFGYIVLKLSQQEIQGASQAPRSEAE